LHSVDVTVGEGESVVVLGPNGAGKSTLLRAIMGLVRARGAVVFDGVDCSSHSTGRRAESGMIMVPEGRGIFGSMTVRENLDLGVYARARASAADLQCDRDAVFALFPRLKERLDQTAGSLSGGEQQMLAIGRALMADPRLLLLDEPSLGLAPKLADEIFLALQKLHGRGLSMLVVEQKAPLALEMAQRAYVLQMGVVATELDPKDVRSTSDLSEFYIGTAAESRHV
jgi:branched-chain amino acid transport system ATP-binding protein